MAERVVLGLVLGGLAGLALSLVSRRAQGGTYT